MDQNVEGFLVHAWVSQGQFRAAGRLSDGRSFAVVDRRLTSALVLPAEEADRAAQVLAGAGLAPQLREVQGFDGTPRSTFAVAPGDWDRGLRVLLAAGLKPSQELPRPAEDYLTVRRLRGTVRLEGRAVPGNRVDVVFAEPLLSPCETRVSLRWLSLDIETAGDGEVRAVALVTSDGGEVLFRPDYLDERGLLEAVSSRLRTLDPDVITGWNVLDFDLAHLAGRYQKWDLPFAWGRTDEPVAVRPKSGGRTSAFIPGRQAVDALRVARMSGTRFEDQSLDTVANAVLGTGKTVSLKGEEKLRELDGCIAMNPRPFANIARRTPNLFWRFWTRPGLAS